jgi:hypothetical protein
MGGAAAAPLDPLPPLDAVERGTYLVQLGPFDKAPRIADPGARRGAAGVQERAWVTGTLRARAGAAGREGILLHAQLPTAATTAATGRDAASSSFSAGTPEGCFVLLSLASRLHASSPWRAKDVVFLFTADTDEASAALWGEEASPAQQPSTRTTQQQQPRRRAAPRSVGIAAPITSPGVAAWLRSYRYDAAEEARLARAADLAASSLQPLAYARLQLRAWESTTAARLLDASGLRATDDAGPGSAAAWPSWVRPTSSSSSGAFRGAISLDLPPSARAAPVRVAVLTQGIGGRQPELDMYTLVARSVSSIGGAGGGDSSSSPLTPLPALSGGPHRRRGGPRTPRLDRPDDALARLIELVRRGLRSLAGGAAAAAASSSWLPLADAAVTRADGLLRFAHAQTWGPTGPHGELIGANIPAVTVQAVYPDGAAGGAATTDADTDADKEGGPGVLAAMHVGRALEKVTRALCGLEERLHASPPFYMLMSADHFVGLAESMLAFGVGIVPVLLLSAVSPPTGRGALYALAVCGIAVATAVILHFALMSDAFLAGALSVVQAYLPWLLPDAMAADAISSSPAAAAVWVWLLVAALAYAALVGVALPVLARAWKRPGKGNAHNLTTPAAASSPSRPLPLPLGPADVIRVALTALGGVLYPLAYPCYAVSMAAALTVLPYMTTLLWLHSAATPRATAVARLVWAAASPASVVLAVALAGAALPVAEALADLRGLHAVYGLRSPQLPFFTLVLLPLHAALGAAEVGEGGRAGTETGTEKEKVD